MKNIYIPVFVLLALAGCTNTGMEEKIDSTPAEIRLNADVHTNVVVKTRDAISSGTDFTATVLGWETNSTATEYTGTATWVTDTRDIQVSTTAVPVSFVDKQYYQSDGGKTFMKAISPVLNHTVAADVYSFEPAIAKDGSADVLLSEDISGTKANTNLNLSFKHALTRLTFTVIKDASIQDDDADQVEAIRLKNVRLPTGFDIAQKEWVLESVPTLDVLQTTDAPVALPSSKGTALQAGKSVMVASISDGTKLEIIVTTNHGQFTVGNIISSTENAFNAGLSYTIELSFGRKEISSATATVVDWKDETGSGTVE